MTRARIGLATAGIFAALGIAAAAVAAEQGHGDHGGMITAADDSAINYQPGPAILPKGIQLAVVMGDPAKPGPFVLRLKIPANTVIAPHTHATAETVTLLGGSFTHDMGDKIVESRGKKLDAGGFVYLPGEMAHSLWTKDQPAHIQVNGTGPFGLKYVNPADDPSKGAQ